MPETSSRNSGEFVRKGNKPSRVCDIKKQQRHLGEDSEASDPENSSPK